MGVLKSDQLAQRFGIILEEAAAALEALSDANEAMSIALLRLAEYMRQLIPEEKE